MSEQSPSEVLDRTPPHSLENERVVLGSVILVPQLLDELAWLPAASFYADPHRRIWSALLALHKDGLKIDENALANLLRTRGDFEAVGGGPYLFECVESVGSPATAHQLCRTIQADADLRKLIQINTQVLRECCSRGNPVETLAHGRRVLGDGLNGLDDSTGADKLLTLEDACYANLDDISRASSGLALTPTSLTDLDAAVGGGTGPEEVIVVGGRPSMGKSMMALHWLDALSSVGEPCAIINEETSAGQIADRETKRITALDPGQWREHVNAVRAQVMNHFRNSAPLYIASNLGTAEKACAMIDRLCRTKGVKTVCVDYLQLLRGEGRTPFDQVSDACQQLVKCSRRNKCRLILLSQLNREVEKRPGQVPVMSDLRQTGQIEQDADVILFVQWPHRVDSDNARDLYRIYVAKCKNRGVRKAVVEVKFDDDRQTLKDQPKGLAFGGANYDYTQEKW